MTRHDVSSQAHDACRPAAFEAKYLRAEDPWNFRGSAYEQARYAATMAALARPRYGAAFEAGCSVGELTWRLAERCDSLRAIDVSRTAVDRAIARCGARPGLEIRTGDLGRWTEDASYDLIVLSEIGYYFERAALAAIALHVRRALSEYGEVLAVHWLGTSADHLLHGDDVHAVLAETLELRRTLSERHPHFRIDRWERR